MEKQLQTTGMMQESVLQRKRTRMRKIKHVGFELVVIFLSVLFCIPLYLIVINAFKTSAEIIRHPLTPPLSLEGWDNIWRAFEQADILRSYLVTFAIGGMTVVYIVFASSIAAYAIARGRSFFFKAAYWVFLSCILMPVQSAFIPLIFLLKYFDLYNNLFGISLVYIAVLAPFCIFMYTGFIRGIPIELEESAFLDGCSPIRTFFQIIFPLLKPVTATLIIMQFIYVWNDLLLPLVILNPNDYPTVSLGLYKFFGAKGQGDMSLLFGGIILVLLPVVLLFLRFQKYFVKGLSSGAIKG
ncbi:carbohydrate ABC transporter permease [Aneurinibacillus sp. REN35]|uniref:carbohydrate ABC transporter permease n=1 Tax=Aneurinibacillus sp. REN35 TaxID=3237286 RepID=UPI003527D4AC